MKSKDYVQWAMSKNLTAQQYHELGERFYDSLSVKQLLHSAVGIASEAGELMDAVKKHWLYNKALDVQNLKEELGDLCWYMALMLDQIGSSFEEVMEMNRVKLEKRYPSGFTEKAAQERADKVVAKLPPTPQVCEGEHVEFNSFTKQDSHECYNSNIKSFTFPVTGTYYITIENIPFEVYATAGSVLISKQLNIVTKSKDRDYRRLFHYEPSDITMIYYDSKLKLDTHNAFDASISTYSFPREGKYVVVLMNGVSFELILKGNGCRLTSNQISVINKIATVRENEF